MEEQNECRTKAELMQENESLRAENETLQDAKERLKTQLSEMEKSKDYWVTEFYKLSEKVKVYTTRTTAMQHTIVMLARIIGKLDITALTKEEQA